MQRESNGDEKDQREGQSKRELVAQNKSNKKFNRLPISPRNLPKNQKKNP